MKPDDTSATLKSIIKIGLKLSYGGYGDYLKIVLSLYATNSNKSYQLEQKKKHKMSMI